MPKSLKEYGAIITNASVVNGVFYGQDQEVFQHSSAFTFKPWENDLWTLAGEG